MSTLHNGKLIVLPSAARERAQEQAERALSRLVAEADDALAGVNDGDIDSIFAAHRAVNRAVSLVLDNHLSTLTARRPRTCRQCGADVSHGRCWGCGAPQGSAS